MKSIFHFTRCLAVSFFIISAVPVASLAYIAEEPQPLMQQQVDMQNLEIPIGVPVIPNNNNQEVVIVPQEESVSYFIEFHELPAASQFNSYPISVNQRTSAQQYAGNLSVLHAQYIAQINNIISGFAQRQKTEVFYVLNGITVDLNSSEKDQIENLSFVKKVFAWPVYRTLLQQSIPYIHTPQVWQEGYTGEGVKVGVIDTGIYYTHADFAVDGFPNGCLGEGCKIEGGYDFFDNDNDPADDHGHGTHVAATIAGNGIAGNWQPIRGVAPDATLYAYRACGYLDPEHQNHGCPGGALSAALDQAVVDQLDVVSMSLGASSNDPDDPMSLAVDNLVNSGVVVVVSAGNDYQYKTINSPGTSRKAITVGASFDYGDSIADFSSKGPLIDGSIKPDVSAPGQWICAAKYPGQGMDASDCIDNEHINLRGTSMAAPHVSGLAALLLEQHPTWNPDQVKYAIRNSAVEGTENAFKQGHGRVDALTASQEIVPVIVKINKLTDSVSSAQYEASVISYHDQNQQIYNYTYDVGYMGQDPQFQPWDLPDPQIWDPDLHAEGTVTLMPGQPTVLGLSSVNKLELVNEGVYLVRVQITGNGQESTDYHSFIVDNTQITDPYDGDVWRTSFDFLGTMRMSTGHHYSIDYAPQGTESWTTAGIVLENDGQEPVESGTLGQFNAPADTQRGFYQFRLSVYNGGELFKRDPMALVYLDPTIREGFPARMALPNGTSSANIIPTIGNVDDDPEKEITFLRSNDQGLSSVYVIGVNGGLDDIISLDDGYNGVNKFSLFIEDLNADDSSDFLYHKYDTEIENRVVAHDRDGEVLYSNYFSGIMYRPNGTFNALWDLDHNGIKEHIFTVLSVPHRALFAMQINGEANPEHNWPQLMPDCSGTNLDAGVGVGNFDDDADDEIVYVSDSVAFCEHGVYSKMLWLFNSDGTQVREPLYIDAFAVHGSPSTADFNNDGKDEIVINTSSGIYVYRPNTQQLERWFPDVDFRVSSPAIADMNGDGVLDIIISSFSSPYTIYILNQNGTIITSWENLSGDDRLGPILGDIDSDGNPDVIYATYEWVDGIIFTKIMARNAQGQIIDGFAKYVESVAFTDKSLVDLDGDGTLEFVATADGFYRMNGDYFGRIASEHHSIFAWDLNIPADSSIQKIWPTLRQGYDRSGHYPRFSAPINFEAHRGNKGRYFGISAQWQEPPPANGLIGYVLEVSRRDDFADTESVDISLGRTSHFFRLLRGGFYYARLGSFDNAQPRNVLWSQTERVCVPGQLFMVCPDEEQSIDNLGITPGVINWSSSVSSTDDVSPRVSKNRFITE